MQGCLWTLGSNDYPNVYIFVVLFQRINDIITRNSNITALSCFQVWVCNTHKQIVQTNFDIICEHCPLILDTSFGKTQYYSISFHFNSTVAIRTKHNILFYSFQQSRDFVEPTTRIQTMCDSMFLVLIVDVVAIGRNDVNNGNYNIISKSTISLENFV